MSLMENFQRNISYTIVRKDDYIVMSATMEDAVHDMELKVVVEPETLLITSASVTFHKSPTPDCSNTATRLDLICGITIGKGLEWKLKRALGCRNGCGNLLNLLQGLLPLALNYRASAGIGDRAASLDAIHQQLLGTCAGYPFPPADDKEL